MQYIYNFTFSVDGKNASSNLGKDAIASIIRKHSKTFSNAI